ncbi:MAG: hypothetical protein HY078_02925 [Elusimicrobia bacterium]|nr:hypothetical protein [Elusimicrobiota bacterium]
MIAKLKVLLSSAAIAAFATTLVTTRLFGSLPYSQQTAANIGAWTNASRTAVGFYMLQQCDSDTSGSDKHWSYCYRYTTDPTTGFSHFAPMDGTAKSPYIVSGSPVPVEFRYTVYTRFASHM